MEVVGDFFPDGLFAEDAVNHLAHVVPREDFAAGEADGEGLLNLLDELDVGERIPFFDVFGRRCVSQLNVFVVEDVAKDVLHFCHDVSSFHCL